MKTIFTRHAFGRIPSRLSLSCESIAEILEKDQCCLLGKDGDSNRGHYLFYSTLDKGWFVAIQDQETGEVVTIIPVEYHNRWKVSFEALQLARSLIPGEKALIDTSSIGWHAPDTRHRESPTLCRLSAILVNQRQETRKIILGSVPIEHRSMDDIISDPATHVVLKERLREQMREDECCYEIWARFGKKSSPTIFNLPVSESLDEASEGR